MLEMHRRAMRHSADMVALIEDEQWELPTPCAQWTLRDLVEHMVVENQIFTVAAGGTLIDRTDDLRDDFARSADRVVTAFENAHEPFPLPQIGATFPAAQAISFHLLDYVVHAWDVAASIGHPIKIEDDLVLAVQEIADREAPDGPRRHRPGASFSPAIPASADATPLDRLLTMLGRSPRYPEENP